MAGLDLGRLSAGDRVQHELLVRERAEKRTGAGDPYWVLTLGNASGTVDTAPVWHDKAGLIAGVERGSVVQVIGAVTEYKGRRQLELVSCRPLPRDEFDPAQFLPAVPLERREKVWSWIDRELAGLQSAPLRAAAALCFGDPAFRERFDAAPGSTAGHHAAVGGLLVHTGEVARIAQESAKVMRANAELAFVGALLHDIGKVEAYRVDAGGFGVTPAGHLAGHIVLGTWMLAARLAAAPGHGLSGTQVLELQHFILSHHGSLEFGASVQPMTTEAEIVHWADEMSAKANDMLESLSDDAHFAAEDPFSTKRPWRVGRRLWRRPDHW